MKKILFAFVMLLSTTMTTNAMSYEQARKQALFLTDKMAYELNLTEEQYEAAFEINLDYLMSVNTVDDVFSTYWTRRNLDFSYILFDWQYRAFCDALYFYRPLYWDAGYWHFRVYSRYPHRNYYYFGRPQFWTVYRGGHSWHRNGGRSWYKGRDFGRHTGTGNHHGGMRDKYDRGEWNKGGRGGDNNNKHDRNGKNDRNGKDKRFDGKFEGDKTIDRESVNNDRTVRYGRGQITPGKNNDRRQGEVGRSSSTRTTGLQRGKTSTTTPKLDRSTQTTPRNTFTPSTQSTQPGSQTATNRYGSSTSRSSSVTHSSGSTNRMTRSSGSSARTTSPSSRNSGVSSSVGRSSSRNTSVGSSRMGSSSNRNSSGSQRSSSRFGGRR